MASPHSARVRKALGITASIQALLLTPPLFERFFAPSFLLASDRVCLWVLAAGLGATALSLLCTRAGRIDWLAAIYLGVLILFSVELATRLVVVNFFPSGQRLLAAVGRLAYPELAAYTAHPFVQFTGNPSGRIVEDRLLGDLATFNNFGFHGADFTHVKPEGVVRIAALGGSTTARGYPKVLAEYVQEQLNTPSVRVEALNFGLGWYNSAHSLANFVFNVRDLDPDYVIIHHATNEKAVRNFATRIRGDYTHALKPFEAPLPYDWIPLRASVIYRYLRYRLAGGSLRVDLTAATRFREGNVSENRYSDPTELDPFRRNIETIIDLALIEGIFPVLTTQPYRSTPLSDRKTWTPHMVQANRILREIAAEYAERVLFVDLDSLMTGTMDDAFIDFVHVDDIGRRFKAQTIGDVIVTHQRDGAFE